MDIGVNWCSESYSECTILVYILAEVWKIVLNILLPILNMLSARCRKMNNVYLGQYNFRFGDDCRIQYRTLSRWHLRWCGAQDQADGGKPCRYALNKTDLESNILPWLNTKYKCMMKIVVPLLCVDRTTIQIVPMTMYREMDVFLHCTACKPSTAATVWSKEAGLVFASHIRLAG